MKKFVLLLLSVVVIASCSFQPETVTPAQIPQKPTVEDIQRYTLDRHDELAFLHLAVSHNVSPQELEKQVKSFLASGTGVSRSAGSAGSAITGVKKVSIAEGKGFPARSAPGRSVTDPEELPEIPFYLFSLENAAEQTTGYVLACGDKRLPGIIAVVEDGDFEDENPFREVFLANLTDYITETIEIYNNITEADIAEALKNWENKQEQGNSRLMSPEILLPANPCWPSSLIKTQWGQNYPYNKVLNSYTNNIYYLNNMGGLPTGCVATALAQIMAYHEWPQAPFPALHHSTIGLGVVFDKFTDFGNNNATVLFSDLSYDWANMKSRKQAASLDLQYQNEVSVLMFQLGCAVNMIYGLDGSVAPNENVLVALVLMGYLSGTLVNYDINHIVLSIINGLPVYVVAAYTLYGTVGHAWVIDNYKIPYVKIEIQPGVFQERWFPYVHCNLGWYGAGDGWYYSGIFDTTTDPVDIDPVDLDDKDKPIPIPEPYAHVFQYRQKIIPYIQPIR